MPKQSETEGDGTCECSLSRHPFSETEREGILATLRAASSDRLALSETSIIQEIEEHAAFAVYFAAMTRSKTTRDAARNQIQDFIDVSGKVVEAAQRINREARAVFGEMALWDIRLRGHKRGTRPDIALDTVVHDIHSLRSAFAEWIEKEQPAESPTSVFRRSGPGRRPEPPAHVYAAACGHVYEKATGRRPNVSGAMDARASANGGRATGPFVEFLAAALKPIEDELPVASGDGLSAASLADRVARTWRKEDKEKE